MVVRGGLGISPIPAIRETGNAYIPDMGVDLSKTGLADKYHAAKVSMDKNHISDVRAAVYLVLDRSGSMRRFYRDGSVQNLAEQALALAAHFDDDGTVPVVFFDSVAYPPMEVQAFNYRGAVDHGLAALPSIWGTTNYSDAMRAVIAHYRASGTGHPAFVIFQTDGSPDSKSAAETVLCEAATLPIFWQFIGFGDDKFAFLRKLDELKVPRRRVVDNAGFFPAGPDPQSIDDVELYDKLMAEFPQWLKAYGAYTGIGAGR
jgi:hypothetical protein